MSDPETIATYERVAERYRERHGDRSDVAGLVERFLAALERSADGADQPRRDPPRVLDVGCGPGWESATFAEAGVDVLGIDLTAAFLEAATDTAPAADLARMDMRQLGLAAGSFDGLWACASFLHVPREAAPATLAGFDRVLDADGVLALTVKRGEGTRAGDTYEGDERAFVLWEPAELRQLVDGVGFDVETVEAEGGWLFVLARAGRAQSSSEAA